MPTPDDQKRAIKAVKFIIEKYEGPRKAFEKADAEMCQARVEIGTYLFDQFFGGETERITGKKKIEPLHQAAYLLLLTDPDLPQPLLDSKTGLRNLVMLGYQTKWLEEKGIKIHDLIKQGKILYTHLVRLDSMPYDERKIQLLKDIEAPEKAFTVSELEAEIKKRLKKSGEEVTKPFPADFDTVMATGWLPEVIKENAQAATAGVIEVDEQSAKKMMEKLFEDLKAAVAHGFDDQHGGILEIRGDQIEKNLRDALERAKQYVEYCNNALKKLQEKRKDLENSKKGKAA